jgi:hypothetical protein
MKADTNYIWITTSLEGFHAYPDAPEEVSFLRNRHRHMFHFRIYIQVFHDDREIEFFMFKRDVENMIKVISINDKSCEMISDELHYAIQAKYPKRSMTIEVSEDLENGSHKVYQYEDRRIFKEAIV